MRHRNAAGAGIVFSDMLYWFHAKPSVLRSGTKLHIKNTGGEPPWNLYSQEKLLLWTQFVPGI